VFFASGPVRVKICGVTSLDDAENVIAAGAEAIGFNVFPGSKRFVTPDHAIPLAAALEGRITRVAVGVNTPAAVVARLLDSGAFDAFQFHGDESPAQCAAAGFTRWIRAIRVQNDADFHDALAFPTPHLLVDAFQTGSYGGTGEVVDWAAVRRFASLAPDRRIILAGGLTPENVAVAIATARPAAVDVASGVESHPGRKDPTALRQFVEAVRAAA
jgi:phosphoribosylanthranilate isomerase